MVDGYILTSASFITCHHGGRFLHTPSYTPGYLIEGSPICRKDDLFTIVCPLGAADGCSKIFWEHDTSGILFLGKPILTTASVGQIFNYKGLLTGSPLYLVFQTKITLKSFVETLQNSPKTK